MENEISTSAPIGWISARLEEIVAVLDSQRIPVNNGDREKRLAKAKELYPYYGATGQVGYIDGYIFEGEAVLLGEDAAPFLEFGKDKAYIVDGRFWVNNHAHILRGITGLDNKFLCHQLNITDYRNFVSGTTRLKLTQGSMRNIPLLLPPLNEQKRIVDKIDQLFSNLDEGEALLKQVQKQLETYRQSVLKAAFTGELIGLKQDDWPELKLGQLLTDIRYGTAKKCTYDPSKTAVLRIPNVAQGKIDLSNLKHTDFTETELKKLRLKAGDILLVRSNGSVSLVGLSAVVKERGVGCAYAGYLIRLRLTAC